MKKNYIGAAFLAMILVGAWYLVAWFTSPVFWNFLTDPVVIICLGFSIIAWGIEIIINAITKE